MNSPRLFCVWLVAILALSRCPLATAGSLDDSLRPLYDVTENFLDVLQPVSRSLVLREILPKVLNQSSLIDGGVQDTALHYTKAMVGYAILLCLGVLLIIVVPLAGCCVCCCRSCCNSCGGRLNYMERKGAKCRRITYGLLSLIFTTAMLFGGVYAMLANQQLHAQLTDRTSTSSSSSSGGSGDSALGALSAAINSTMDLLHSAPRQGREAMPRVMSELVNNLKPILNSTLVSLQTLIVVNKTRADAAVAAARNTLDSLAVAEQAANASATGHEELVKSLTSLNAVLGKLTNFSCPNNARASDCDIVNSTIQNRSSILGEPPMAATLVDLAKRLREQDAVSMRATIDRANASMNNISTAGMQLFTEMLSSINDSQLMKIWDDLENVVSSLDENTRMFRNLSLININDPLTGKSSTIGSVVSAADTYRYYAFIVIAAFALLLVLLFYLGLLYGLTGEPPYEDAGCCNRGVGARFQLAGAGLGFIFYALIMIIVIVLFLPGAVTYTEGCRYIRNRPGTDGYRLIDDILMQALRRGDISLGGTAKNFTSAINRPVSILLGGCSNGASVTDIIDMAQLAKIFNLNSTIAKILNDTRNKISEQGSSLLSGVSFNISSLQDLNQHAANASGTNFTQYTEKLQSSRERLEVLRAAALNITKEAIENDAKNTFGNLTASVSATQAVIANQTARLNQMPPLMTGLASNSSDMIAKLNFTDSAINTPGMLVSALDTATAGLDGQLISQVNAALPRLLGQIIDCPKLGQYLRQIVDVPCARLLQPFNGFWAGIGICLISLLPCLVLAIKLANLYRKTQKYLPDFEDENPKPV